MILSAGKRLWHRVVIVAAVLLVIALVVPWPHPRHKLSGTECYDTPMLEWAHELAAYMAAGRMEASWRGKSPHARAELESYLSLYSTQDIMPPQSCWGRRWRLEPHEKMVQYLILWHAPLDVVYDREDRIRMIFTSYE